MHPTLHSYIVRYDSAFAPNPFYSACTLATCKPAIRRSAQVGDWVVGTGSGDRKIRRAGHLVYAMRVTETKTFEEYYSDERFQLKKPNLHGSRKRSCGDNIYSRETDTEAWRQLDSFHSHKDGTPNGRHITRDTGVNRVLISDDFVYFGGEGPAIPNGFRDYGGTDVCRQGVGWKKITNQNLIADFVAWLRSFEESGYRGSPTEWILDNAQIS